MCRYDTAVYAGTELAAVGERLAQERDRFVRAWASHEVRLVSFVEPLHKCVK